MRNTHAYAYSDSYSYGFSNNHTDN